jgi:hypothetical protein
MSDEPMSLRRRLWVRYYGYRRFAGFRLPGGVKVLSFEGNMPGFCLVSRHPRWSITWLWFIRVAFGSDRMECPWWKRFGFSWQEPYSRQSHLSVGWIHVSLHTQDAMAQSPGRNGYDRKQWVRYCERIARRRADHIAAEAYRHELARMMEPAPQEDWANG